MQQFLSLSKASVSPVRPERTVRVAREWAYLRLASVVLERPLSAAGIRDSLERGEGRELISDLYQSMQANCPEGASLPDGRSGSLLRS